MRYFGGKSRIVKEIADLCKENIIIAFEHGKLEAYSSLKETTKNNKTI